MNELLFFCHIFVVAAFVLGALRLGLSALVTLAALMGVLANLFVVKGMTLFAWDVTCSDVFAVGGILTLNLIQEFFGRTEAKRAVKISFVMMAFFLLMAQFHLGYAPRHEAFEHVLGSTVRLVSASLVTFYIVQQLDVRLFARLKGSFPLRAGISMVSSQFVDTALFTFIGLYGVVSDPWDVLWFSFFVKLAVVACLVPFTYFARRYVQV